MKKLVFGVHPVAYPDGGPNLGEVAIWNEYGTTTAPPRPAFRMGLEAAQRTNKKMIQAFLKNTSTRILQGRTADIDRNLTTLLTQIGRSAKKETQEIIKMGSTTPNAPSTIDKKGFDHPLYETGLLLENVDYEVTE